MRRDARHTALTFLVLSLLGAGLIAFQMGANLLPQKDNAIIWGLSVTVLTIGLLRALYDIGRLSSEWRALAKLQGRVKAESLAAEHPKTAVGARAALVHAAIAERRVDREFRQSNRAEAAAMLDPIGNVTRFLGSALLVLAVMGTFAGMKSALPYLREAITQAGQSAGGGEQSTLGAHSIGIALGHVSDAFGANFVALFGSLLLGAAAFGAILERRRFLSRLEHLSERFLYRELPSDADASELQTAVYELQRSVTSIAEIGFAVDRLGGGISDLKSVLRDTLSEMHTSFNDSVRRHGLELQTQLNTTVTDLTTTLSGTTKALEATSVAYQGLVKGLEERDLGLARAATSLESGIAQVQEIQGVAAAAARDAAAASKDAAAAAAEATSLAIKAEDTLALAGTRVVDAAEHIASAVDMHARRLAEIAARLVDLRDDQTTTRTALGDELRAAREELQGIARELSLLPDTVRTASGDAAASAVTEIQRSSERLDSALSRVSVDLGAAGEKAAERFAAGADSLTAALSSVRQTFVEESRAAAAYTSSESTKQFTALVERLHAVHAAVEAAGGTAVRTVEAFQGAAMGRADQAETLRSRTVQQLEVLQRELGALRADIQGLAAAVTVRDNGKGEKVGA